MSNSSYTDFLQLPSGRSVRRLKQDAKRLNISRDDIIKQEGINLPWRVAIDYLKDVDSLKVSKPTKSVNILPDLIPKDGMVNFLLGTPNAHIAQTMLQVMMMTSMVEKGKNIAYCDFALGKKNSVPTAANFDRSAPLITGYDREPFIEELDRLKGSWQKSFDLIKEKANDFQSAKIPQRIRFKDAASLAMFAINPRKFVVSTLIKLAVKGCGLLIADNKTSSLASLGSAKHWQQLPNERCAQERRDLLSRTNCITEQRGVDQGEESLLLRRSLQLGDDDRSAFADKYTSVGDVIADVNGRMMSGEQAAQELADKVGVSPDQLDKLMSKAKAYDASSSFDIKRSKPSSEVVTSSAPSLG